jgi:hypothetical protein
MENKDFLSFVGIGWIATGEPIVSQAAVKASSFRRL